MFCSKCGTECDDGVSFCPNCGSSLNSNDTQTRELSTGYDMFDYFGISSNEKEKISRVVELNVKYSLGNENSEKNFEIVCFEESNKWYILDID